MQKMVNFYQSITVLMALLLLCACVRQDTTVPEQGDSERDYTGRDYVALSKGACFGTCPVFDARLYGDGRLFFDADRFTQTKGQQKDDLGTGRFVAAISSLKANGFADMNSSYTADNCGSLVATDHATIIIKVKTHDWQKEVTWYTGCRMGDVSRTLKRIVKELDDLMETARFVGK